MVGSELCIRDWKSDWTHVNAQTTIFIVFGGSFGVTRWTGRRDHLALEVNVRLRRRCKFSLGNIDIGEEPPSWPGKGGGRGRSFRT